MKLAQVQSRCECEALLFAEVSEAGRVVEGWSKKGKNARELTPATAMNAGSAQFQVGWLCPECGRNTMRSFFRGALVYREIQAPAPDAPTSVAPTS